MIPLMPAKTLTLRLSASDYERAGALAGRRGQSSNRMFQDAMALLDQQEREKRLFDDFSMIAEAGAEETGVGYGLEAQNQATSGS